MRRVRWLPHACDGSVGSRRGQARGWLTAPVLTSASNMRCESARGVPMSHRDTGREPRGHSVARIRNRRGYGFFKGLLHN